MSDEIIQHSARVVIAEAVRRSVTLTTAESCTGGMVSAALTAIEGSSAAFGWGFVTYSNLAKQTLLDVSAAELERYGAVSEVVARAMAAGARRASNADVAVAITGIAGPGGGSPAKPVGLVHFGVSTRTASRHRVEMFGALGRDQVREKSVIVALDLFREALTDFGPSQTG